MKQLSDPAPALTRGIALIRQLSLHGQGTLEDLARRGGWPKSSTLRYLQALQQSGITEQDPVSKIWHLREHLTAFAPDSGDVIEFWRGRIGSLCQDLGHCVELYRVAAGAVTLIDRVDPLVQDKQLSARIGFVRDPSECDATALLFFAFSGQKTTPKDLSWRWCDGERANVRASERDNLLREARISGTAIDPEFNLNGIRRFAFGLFTPDGTLGGILAIAQRLTPLSARQTESIRSALEKLRFEATHSSNLRMRTVEF